MQNPGFITLNGHRIKAQRWHSDSHAITFTAVIHGENLANELVAAIDLPRAILTIDDESTLAGNARLLKQRGHGDGPTAVHRLEIEFIPEDSPSALVKLTADEKLDAILAELRALRREVNTLRGRQAPGIAGGIAPPSGSSTLLDFKLPADGENND